LTEDVFHNHGADDMSFLTTGMNRRELLRNTMCGFGGLALHSMAADLARAAASGGDLRRDDFSVPARARRIIFLFMEGGPSQQDLFDPKDLISRNHGKTIDAPIDDHQIRLGVDKFLAMRPVATVRPRGECGMMISDLLPNLAELADDLCLLRAMKTDNKAHAPASLQLHTGALVEARPSMGSWISYGLGTENENLPGFITIQPPADGRAYGSAFLPAAHQGMAIGVPQNENESAIKYLEDSHVSADSQHRRLAFVQNLNRRLVDRVGADAQMEGIIESFELAFRMQAETPGLIDISGESESTRELYGIGEDKTDRTGRACLLARRLSEAGVRFVQVSVPGWDHHAHITSNLPTSCAGVDKPIAGLLKDLKRRGLLEETLVVWSGEFGRSPWGQALAGDSSFASHGREHQQESFCTWMAGAGVRGGMTYGATDDFGFLPVEGTVHLHDLHATMLYLMGIDHEKLTYRHGGRDFRLTDVYGKVVREILA
jgi:hypothetical protein